MTTSLSNTFLTVSLSSTLDAQLHQTSNNGYIYMDAVWFGQDGNAHWTPMVAQSQTVQSSIYSNGSWSINLPQTTPNYSGKIFFLISSVANTQTTDPLSGYNYSTGTFTGTPLITGQSQISYVSTSPTDTSGTRNSYTFDSLEFSLQNTPTDVANLTSIVGSGIPMGFATSSTPSLSGAAGFKTSDSSIATNIQAVVPNTVGSFSAGPLAGQSNFIIAPGSNGQNNYKNSDWIPYLDKLVAIGNNFQSPIAKVAGVFNGGADAQKIYQNGVFYDYTVTAGAHQGVNYFAFAPTSNSQAQQGIIITETELAKSIYKQQGSAYIFQKDASGNWVSFIPNISPAMQTGAGDVKYPIDGFNSSGGMNVGWNNSWGNLFTNFVTSIDTGQLGVTGVSPNPNSTVRGVGPIDLSASWNISPAYMFGASGTNTSALTTGPSALQPDQQYFDPYAKQFFLNTNSYGNAYTDNATKNYSIGGPDINITNGTQDLANLNLTLYAFNEANVPTPPVNQISPTSYDYVTPVLNNYLAAPNPSQGPTNWYGYSQPKIPTGSSLGGQLQINFDLPTGAGGSPNVVVTPNTWAALRMMDPSTGQFIQVILNPNSGYVQQLNYNNGQLSLTQQPNPVNLGEILLNGLPITTNGTYWFQIFEGDQNTGQSFNQKVFNLYVQTSSDPNNLLGTGSSLMIDGGAQVAAAQGLGGENGINVNLNFGSNIMVNGNTMQAGPTTAGGYAIFGTPTSPVAGLATNPIANPFGMTTSTIYNNETQGTQDTNTHVTITQKQLPNLVLGWTGMNDVNVGTSINPAYNATSWIGGFTNKAAGGDFVLATITGGGVTYYMGGTAQADGQWALSQWYDGSFAPLSAAPALTNGVYTITTQEYAGHSAVAASSSPLNLFLI